MKKKFQARFLKNFQILIPNEDTYDICTFSEQLLRLKDM